MLWRLIAGLTKLTVTVIGWVFELFEVLAHRRRLL